MSAKYAIEGRPLTIVGAYDGDDDEPSGYYYTVDDEDPRRVYWISATGAAVRFQCKDEGEPE